MVVDRRARDEQGLGARPSRVLVSPYASTPMTKWRWPGPAKSARDRVIEFGLVVVGVFIAVFVMRWIGYERLRFWGDSKRFTDVVNNWQSIGLEAASVATLFYLVMGIHSDSSSSKADD